MKRVIIYCEGPTEETFVNQILAPALYPYQVYATASSCNGVSKYSIIKRDLENLCKHDPTAVITTMLDYYGLPSDTPGLATATQVDITMRAAHVEAKMKADISVDNLMPNLISHEFEGLLFSRPECFSYCGLSGRILSQLQKIRDNVPTPEYINNSPNTAPSKRILAVYPEYSKVLDGYQIAKDIGLSTIQAQCPHFNAWVERLKALDAEGSVT